MSPHRIIWWTTLVVLAIILVMTALQLMRALRELKRVNARIDGYADLPLVKALQRAERDGRRLEAALAQIDPLVARATLAVATIRKGPLPPEIVEAVRRIGSQIGDFRRFARR